MTQSKHFEFTGEELYTRGARLFQIRATRPLPHLGVEEGHLGGWVASPDNIKGAAWVADEAKVFDNSIVSGWALVEGDAIVKESSVVAGSARVGGNAEIYDHSRVLESAQVYDNAIITHHSEVTDVAKVYGNARLISNSVVYGQSQVFDNTVLHKDVRVGGRVMVHGRARIVGSLSVHPYASIAHTMHLLQLHPFGSEQVSVQLVRTHTGHALKVGCWTGTVDTLMEEVAWRKANVWPNKKNLPEQHLLQEYKALEELCRARIDTWKEL